MTREKHAAPAGARTDASLAETAGHLLDRSQLKDSVALAPPVSMRIALVAGLQSGLAVFCAILLALLSPWPRCSVLPPG